MTDRRPRIFLASAKEALALADEMKRLLEPNLDVQTWNDGFFGAGQYTLETLEAKGRQFDAAVVLGSADDQVMSRGVTKDAIRDNLLVEFGFFVALLGRRRALLVLEETGTVKVPSDLYGLTCVGFRRTDPASEGLEGAVEEIRAIAEVLARETVSREVSSSLEAILHVFSQELQEVIGASSLGFHVWVVDERVTPSRLVRVARIRTTPKAQQDVQFQVGEGVVGHCWRTRGTVLVDFTQAPYANATRATWEQFGPDAQVGMGFDLLEYSRGRHLAVGANPIVSSLAKGSAFLGCVSFNVNPSLGTAAFRPEREKIDSVLDRASELCRIVLEPRLSLGL